MKRFKAVIKAKTDSGMSLNYECTNPKGLLVEAINFALITGESVEEIKRMVNEQAAALQSIRNTKPSIIDVAKALDKHSEPSDRVF